MQQTSLNSQTSFDNIKARRTGNFKPNIWSDEYVQSLSSPYGDEKHLEIAEKLKEKARVIIDDTNNELDELELVHDLQRLGICYHFEEQVQKILEKFYFSYKSHDYVKREKDLYFTALGFLLLRQNRYHVPQDLFRGFMNEAGEFDEDLCSDTLGILYLYEASFLSMEGETILEEARDFATSYLKENVKEIRDLDLAELIGHALEIPLHWRVQKLEALWFINAYERKQGMNPVLLQLAKLEYNIVQAMYQNELKEMSRLANINVITTIRKQGFCDGKLQWWYKDTCLTEKLSFARHRLVEGYLWGLGFTPDPQFKYCRRISAKISVLITILDDIYDVYGTLEELKIFTQIMERWDTDAVDKFPEYMKVFFVALNDCVNEMAYDILKDQGFNIILHLRRVWAELCKYYLLEARWFHNGYFPSLNEYLSIAWITISGPLLLFHAYSCITRPINMTNLQLLGEYPGIIRWPSLILRLTDDLATSTDEMERGDVPKSIQCYMHDTGCSEEEARDKIKNLIDVILKKMNKDLLMNHTFDKDFIQTSMNLARISQCMYQYGDGFGIPYCETKKNIIALLVKPCHIS